MRAGLGCPTRVKRNSKPGLERADFVNFFDQVVLSLNRDGFVKMPDQELVPGWFETCAYIHLVTPPISGMTKI